MLLLRVWLRLFIHSKASAVQTEDKSIDINTLRAEEIGIFRLYSNKICHFYLTADIESTETSS